MVVRSLVVRSFCQTAFFGTDMLHVWGFLVLLLHMISMLSHERIGTSVFHAVSDEDHSRFSFIPAQTRAII